MISMECFSFSNYKGEVSGCTGNNVTLAECNKDTVKFSGVFVYSTFWLSNKWLDFCQTYHWHYSVMFIGMHWLNAVIIYLPFRMNCTEEVWHSTEEITKLRMCFDMAANCCCCLSSMPINVSSFVVWNAGKWILMWETVIFGLSANVCA